MTDFHREIPAEIEARLSKISSTDGFKTDIGRTIYWGREMVDDDADVPCCVIVEGTDTFETRPNGRHEVRIKQRYVIEAHSRAEDVDNPSDTAHAMLRDLKAVIFDRQMKLLPNTLTHYAGRAIGSRTPGSHLVFASLAIDVEFVENLAVLD